jgi:thiamine pyrophosphokinase
MLTDKRAFLFANGFVADHSVIANQIRKPDLLIAVDGGLKHLQKIQKSPHILIGDLDSISERQIHQFEKKRIEIRKFSTHKDETDLELALSMLSEFKVSRAVIVGGTGDRLDHSLGNIHLLIKFQSSFELTMDDGQQETFLIGQQSFIHGKPNDIVSLIPLEEKVTGVTTFHLAYPLKNETLYLESTRGISNVMMGQKAEVQKKKGSLLCIHIRSKKIAGKRNP